MDKARKIMKKKARFKAALDKRVSKKKSDALWRRATERLAQYLERYADLPKGVRFHTESRILPAAAVYLTLKESIGRPEAYRVIEEATFRTAEDFGRKLAALMRLPGMRDAFIGIWDPMTRRLFGEDSGFQNVFYPKKKGEYRMDVVSCPYFRYYTELGCPELTKISCGADDRLYGSLPGLKFERTTTLGRGGERCDFCIRKIRGRQRRPSKREE